MSGQSIVDFIRARIDEDEQIARNASATGASGDRETWKYDRGSFAVRATHGQWNVATRRDDFADAREIHLTDSYGEHITNYQPVRVLREVAAKRALLDEHIGYYGDVPDDYWPVRVLTLLALPYSDHSDYDEAWRP